MTDEKVEVTGDELPYIHLPCIFLDMYAGYFTPSEERVFLKLLRHKNNRTKESHPSYRTIHEDTGVSLPVIVAAVRKIEKAGMVTIKKGKQGKHLFDMLNHNEWYVFDINKGELTDQKVQEFLHFHGIQVEKLTVRILRDLMSITVKENLTVKDESVKESLTVKPETVTKTVIKSVKENLTHNYKEELKGLTKKTKRLSDLKTSDVSGKPYKKFALEDYPEIYKQQFGVEPSTSQKDVGYSGRVDKYLSVNFKNWDEDRRYDLQLKLYKYFCWVSRGGDPWFNGHKVEYPTLALFAKYIDFILSRVIKEHEKGTRLDHLKKAFGGQEYDGEFKAAYDHFVGQAKDIPGRS
jgi:DNA-binding transcriptional regulator YhcF (GntR family)